MGEAKRRAEELALWKAGLSTSAAAVFDASYRLFNKFVRPAGATGMCYRLAFFLTEYVFDRNGVVVEPVVGLLIVVEK